MTASNVPNPGAGLAIDPGATRAWAALTAKLADMPGEPPCAADPSRWYGHDLTGRRATAARAEAARACADCEARQPCADYAEQAGERWGIWGGVDRQQTTPATNPHPRQERNRAHARIDHD